MNFDPIYLTHDQPKLENLSRVDWFDNSTIEKFLDCNRLGWYVTSLGLANESPAMAAGSVLHSGLEFWHKNHVAEEAEIALTSVYSQNQATLQQSKNKFSFGNLHRVFDDYVHHYRGKDNLTYHMQEVKLAVWVRGTCTSAGPFCNCRIDDPWRCFWLVGRTDGIVSDPFGLWIFETKTTSGLSQNYLDGLEMGRQNKTYDYMLRRILATNNFPNLSAFRGVLYNVLAFGTTKTEFTRFPVPSPPQHVVDDWLQETRRIVAAIRISWEGSQKPIQNLQQCNRYGKCAFTALCKAWGGRHKSDIPGVFSSFRKSSWAPF